MRPLSFASTVFESKETESEAELRLESQRIEAEAMRQELLYQLTTAKQAIDQLLKCRKKYQKQIVKLENECRRLDAENQQLREELKFAKRLISLKADFMPHPLAKVSVCAQATQPRAHKDPSPALHELSDKVTDLHTVCREQGTKVSSCLAVLKKTRQDNAEILEAVWALQDTVASSKKHCRAASLPESLSNDEITGSGEDRSGECSRLLTEIQDMTDSEMVLEGHLFRGHTDIDDAFLLSSPMQTKVDWMEAEMHRIQVTLTENNKLLKAAPPHHRKSRTGLPPGKHCRKSSLAKAYHRALSMPWSLLV